MKIQNVIISLLIPPPSPKQVSLSSYAQLLPNHEMTHLTFFFKKQRRYESGLGQSTNVLNKEIDKNVNIGEKMTFILSIFCRLKLGFF